MRATATAPTTCDVCGAQRAVWRRCKLVCEQCGTILMSCADLKAADAASAGR